jgi:nucleoside-diphosphate-sugar epimerase
MQIIVIGASGTLGSAVASALGVDHEIVRASRQGAVRVDLQDSATLDTLFGAVPNADAVVCCAARCSGRWR